MNNDEHKCIYISLTGFIKLGDFIFRPLFMVDKLTFSDYSYYLLKYQFHNMVVNIGNNDISFFVNNTLPHIKCYFILLTDTSVGDNEISLNREHETKLHTDTELIKLLENPYLLKLFSQNALFLHEKLIHVPLGVNYSTIYNDHKNNILNNIPGIKYATEQDRMLHSIAKNSKPFFQRIKKILLAFTKVNNKYNQRSSKELEKLPSHLCIEVQSFIPRDTLWNIMKEYAFVLSPAGNGIDCYRTWESLILGCIPIVCEPIPKKLFEDLPVLHVQSWSDINEELLLNTLHIFKYANFNYDKLTLQYWHNKIESFKTY